MSKEVSANTTLSHYRIVSKIGAGGMGEVYLAQDTKLDRKVALKVLPADVAANQERMRRFVREAKAASALNHPNILTIHEIDETDSGHFIATEFIDGETLRERMRTTSMKLSEALEVAAQIASALSAAHAAGIVHRDIKPENIMQRRDGIVKVLDFGLAKLTERLPPESVDTEGPTSFKTDPGTVAGTVVYMSPEQGRGQEVDARTDIWSLGVVLYEMVAGCLPFAGSTSSEVLASILGDRETQPLARYSREVPDELERIVSKALRKNRDERYQTIRDMLLDLKSLKQEVEFERKLERSPPPKSKSGADPRDADGTETVMASATRPTVGEKGATTATKLNQRRVPIVVAALLVIASAAGAYLYFTRARSGAIDSVAVLPFINASGNADVEYLSDGMTETLINSLSQLPKLSVKAPSSVFRYKGKEVDPQTVGNELGVQAILNGRVVQRGDDLTLYLSLVDTRTGNQLWGEQYNRTQADLLSLQNEIGRDVASKLRTRLSGADEQKVSKNYPQNAEAYQLYLQGRFFWNKRTLQSIQKSIGYFQQAIEKDPNYALGYAGLSDGYALLAYYGGAPANEAMPKAKVAAMRAVSLDNNLAESHNALGFVAGLFDYDYAGAEREYRRAIELNPNYSLAHQNLGVMLNRIGRQAEGMSELRRALEIEPFSIVINRLYGDILICGRRYDEALAQLKKTLELDPGFPTTHLSLSSVYQLMGKYAESVESFAKYQELLGRPQTARLAREGFASGGWQGYMSEMTGTRRPEGVSPFMAATFFVQLSEKDKAFAELNKAFENREYLLLYIKIDPRLDPLRDDPRYQDLVRRMRFPE